MGGINHPDLPTIYGPVLQWVFRLGYALAPGSVFALQLLNSLASLGLVALLSRFASPRNLMLFAWSPLVVKELAFTAHPDVWGVLGVFAGALALRRGHAALGGAALAVAVASKVFALLVVPLLLLRSARGWVAFALVLAGLYLPFLDTSGFHAVGLGTALGAMATQFVFNAPLYAALGLVLPAAWLRLLLAGAFAVCFVLLARGQLRRPHDLPRGDLVFGALLIFGPVVNAWYFVWPLAFATVYPSRWAVTASLTLVGSYAIGLNLPASDLAPYEIPPALLALEFVPIAIAGLLDLREHRRSRHERAQLSSRSR